MPRGGSRKGAGRPKSLTEPTKAIRLPLSVISNLSKNYQLPLFSTKVPAGTPSFSDDHIESHLDLNNYLVKDPAQTFLVRASGLSMINAGIHENDLLVVDRSIQPTPGKIVIAAIDGQLTVKRLLVDKKGRHILAPDNKAYQPIIVGEESEVYIWGIVTNVIHSV